MTSPRTPGRFRAPRYRHLWAAACAGLVALGSAATRANDPIPAENQPSREDLLEAIRRLEARVDRLQSAQVEQAGAPSSADVDATVEQVLRDADARGQFLQAEGFTAGYTKGKFLIQSADGNFVLNPNFQFQLRYVANYAEAGDADEGQAASDNIESGFELRRMKAAFDGNVFSPDTTYKFQWAANRRNGNFTLEDAWVRQKLATRWAVRFGQFVEPLFKEQLTSSKRLLAVDRSLLNETIGTGGESYVQGVSLIYDDGQAFRGEVAYHDGIQSVNTNFVDGGGSALLGIVNPDYGVAARVEYKLAGDWKQYDDFSARGNTAGLLVVGAGADYTEQGDASVILHTADIQWEPQAVPGLGLMAAYVGSYRDFAAPPGGADASPYDWGFLVQAGYVVAPKWEVFGRYDYIDLATGAPGGLGAAADVSDTLHEITTGVIHYIEGHALKVIVDFTWLPNGSPITADGSGILGQDDDDDQFLIRGQFQLLL